MAQIEDNVLEKLYGKLVCEQPIRFQDTEFFGDNKKRTINFKIYDGFAYCPDYNGEELFLTYPKLDFVNTCKEMSSSVRDFMGLNDSDKICVTDIVQSYCDIHRI